ncbi:MAG: metal-sulfur cluster assembly factor [bacterium]|nr:metal-sulfur cluster assembly factor [bacterium]
MITEEFVYAALETVLDPEIGIDIVNLGFIYDVKIADDKVDVAMTLTTKGCPMHGSLTQQAKDAIITHTGAAEANIRLVFDPPWNVHMMSESARTRLGIDLSLMDD